MCSPSYPNYASSYSSLDLFVQSLPLMCILLQKAGARNTVEEFIPSCAGSPVCRCYLLPNFSGCYLSDICSVSPPRIMLIAILFSASKSLVGLRCLVVRPTLKLLQELKCSTKLDYFKQPKVAERFEARTNSSIFSVLSTIVEPGPK